jgi:hypothetical protein
MWYLYGPVRNDFDAGKSITWAIVMALNISTFLSPYNGPHNGFARIKIITLRAL